MKLQSLLLVFVCIFGMAQVQTLQAIRMIRLIGAGTAVVGGLVVYVARKPIGEASLALSRGYEDDQETLIKGGYGGLKKKICKGASTKCSLRNYVIGANVSRFFLFCLGFLNRKNETGKKIFERIIKIDSVERCVLEDSNFYQELQGIQKQEDLGKKVFE